MRENEENNTLEEKIDNAEQLKVPMCTGDFGIGGV